MKAINPTKAITHDWPSHRSTRFLFTGFLDRNVHTNVQTKAVAARFEKTATETVSVNPQTLIDRYDTETKNVRTGGENFETASNRETCLSLFLPDVLYFFRFLPQGKLFVFNDCEKCQQCKHLN